MSRQAGINLLPQANLKKIGVQGTNTEELLEKEFPANTEGADEATKSQEEQELDIILEREQTNIGQWRVHLKFFILTTMSALVNLLRGSSAQKSIIGLEHCGAGDWSILAGFFVFLGFYIWSQVSRVSAEQALKLKYKRGISNSEIILQGKTLFFILFFGFFGGALGTAFGLGGGIIYNPTLIGFGMLPSVANATGMYMILWSMSASTALFMSFGMVNWPFALWLGISSAIGIYIGLSGLQSVIKKYNRQSVIVFVLAFVLAIATVMGTIFNVTDLIKSANDGVDILQGGSLCG